MGAAAVSSSPMFVAPPRSILAVVGDPVLKDYLMELAIAEGYGVYCAGGALEALCILGRESPGAVVVDMDMENGGGIRFLDIFRRLRRHDFVKCAAVSAAAVTLPGGIERVGRHELDRLAAVIADHFEVSGDGAGARAPG